jgi:small subunit ribosomal protein S21
LEVRVQSRDIEKALRNLKKKLQLDGVFGEIKKRRYYEKPSVKKKRKRLEAQKRKRKLLKRSGSSGYARKPGSGGAARTPARTAGPATAETK